MPRVRKKQLQDLNVYEASLSRINYLYERFDNVGVSFSGGKDSTAVLQLTLEVARKRGRLPLRVVFFDEEAIHPTTIEYCERVRQNPEIAFEWYCLEIKHRNACSDTQPFWYCWDKDCADKWTRPMPDNVITEHPQFVKGMTLVEFANNMDGRQNDVMLTGMRSEESLRRYRIVTQKKNDHYIANSGRATLAHPVYDWSSIDVWVGVATFGWDYNRTYDIFNMTRDHNKYLKQRVCPPYGEEPLRGLWIYAECFPDMWDKMLERVPGCATAWRYANTSLYTNSSKPDNLTWESYFSIRLQNYDKHHQNLIKKNINSMIETHYSKTNEPIPDEQGHVYSGASWKFFTKIAIKGDFKGRQQGAMQGEGEKTRDRLGLTFEQVIQRYGKENRKESR